MTISRVSSWKLAGKKKKKKKKIGVRAKGGGGIYVGAGKLDGGGWNR